MSTKKLVTVSPYVASGNSTRKIMRDVVIALLPATVMGIYLFGAYALLVILLSVGSALAAEFIYNKITKKPSTLEDSSAFVTGLILALNLPPYVPFYVPIFGSFFAIIVVKMLFGGLGRNFMNPAAAGRVFLLISFSAIMTKFNDPIVYSSFADFFVFPSVDQVSSATPLVEAVGLSQLFLGNVAGSIGETSAIALLIGGAYLIVRKVISYKIPLVLIGTVFGLAVVFGGTFQDALYEIYAGGLMLGAFFMATDYSTSPNTDKGKIVFAVLIAVLTYMIRHFGSYPEGISLAILFANLFVPMIDKFLVPKRFGQGRDIVDISIKSICGAFIIVTVVISLIGLVL